MRKAEWTPPLHVERYHKKQLKRVYRSTEKFCDWLELCGVLAQEKEVSVLDFACGGGANVLYMSKRYPRARFVGVDVNRDFVELARKEASECEVRRFFRGDIFDIDPGYRGKFDGITLFQTLYALPNYEAALNNLAALECRWLGITSLFWDGDAEYAINFRDYANAPPGAKYRSVTYTTHRLHKVVELLKNNGFAQVEFIPFEIDIELPKPKKGETPHTYTERLADGRLIQITGPILMPWYFMLARRP